MLKKPSPATGLSLLIAALALLAGGCLTGLPLTLWPLVALAGLAIVNFLPSARRVPLLPAGVALLVAGLCVLNLHYPELKKALHGWRVVVADRLGLDGRVAMFPQRLWSDRPQRLLITAPHSSRVSVRAPGLETIEATAMGIGLFRWDYDPHRQGLPKGPLHIETDRDGSRDLTVPCFVPPRQPGLLSSDPVAGVAATVSTSTDEIDLVKRDGGITRIPVGYGPSSCALFDHARRVAVGHRYGQSVWTVNTTSGQPETKIDLSGMVEALAVSPNGKTLAVLYEGSAPHLAVLTLPELKVNCDHTLPCAGDHVCFGRSDKEIIIASLRGRRLLRASTENSRTEDMPLSLPATALTRSSDGSRVFIASTSGQLDGTPQRGNHYIENVILELDLSNWDWIDVHHTEARREAQPLAGSIDSGVGASDMQLDARGNLMVTYSGSHEIAFVPDIGIETRKDVADDELFCPISAADLGKDRYVVSVPAQAALAVYDADGTLKICQRLEPDDTALKAADYAAWFRRQGQISFYETTNAGISCQSCHTGGESDGAMHDIGGADMFGTLSVSGVAGTAPYLRDASYPSLADLHAVAEIEYRGYAREVDYERGDAIAAYLESLPLPTNPEQLLPDDGTRLEQERRGAAAFAKAECTSCHTLPSTTNLATVPNQILFPPPEGPVYFENLKVPILRNLWKTAPYLHDGRAKTLDDVLVKQNPQNQHGNVKALSAGERADLVAFLRSL